MADLTNTLNYLNGKGERAVEVMNELVQLMIDKFLEPWKHVLWVFYETKKWRNIWWVKWSDSYDKYIEYTHPDTYIHYS